MKNGVASGPLAKCGLILVFSLLAACQTAPVDKSAPGNGGATAPQDDGSAISYDVFPADAILTCPEPEAQPPAPACPEPKPVKCPVCPKPAATARIDGKLVIGAIEHVSLSPPDVVYKARIDTGATGSSIHATNIVRFERDGERWVRFSIDDPAGEPVTLERKIVRRIRVRQAELEGFERRVVVMMTVTLGSITDQLEMSLTDRSSMEFPVLIGRNFLRNIAIVDVSQEMIAK
jgi:hypothetical protein